MYGIGFFFKTLWKFFSLFQKKSLSQKLLKRFSKKVVPMGCPTTLLCACIFPGLSLPYPVLYSLRKSVRGKNWQIFLVFCTLSQKLPSKSETLISMERTKWGNFSALPAALKLFYTKIYGSWKKNRKNRSTKFRFFDRFSKHWLSQKLLSRTLNFGFNG